MLFPLIVQVETARLLRFPDGRICPFFQLETAVCFRFATGGYTRRQAPRQTRLNALGSLSEAIPEPNEVGGDGALKRGLAFQAGIH